MKLALIGDLHLSERSPRYAHVLHLLDWVIDDASHAAHEYGVPLAWVLLGDLFEGQASGAEYAALLERITKMTKLGDVGVVLGNHESASGIAFFEHLSRVTPAWDRVALMEHVTAARVVLIPYPRRGRPPFDAESLRVCGDDGTIAGSMSAAARLIGTEITMARQAWSTSDRRPLIVCGHFTIEGMTTRDAEFELHTATEVVVPQSAFAAAALTAVGHIHQAQDVAPRIIGVGGLVRHSFGEAEDPKSYTLASIDDGVVTWERRAVPAREMRVDRIVWRSGTSIESVQADVDGPGGFTGKEVKLVVEIPEDHLAAFDASVFDPIRDAAEHFVLERQVVHADRTRAPEVAKADTLHDQVAAWLEATGQALDEERSRSLREKVAEVQG